MQADIEKALSCTCIRDFDEALLVPSYGFQSLNDYYRQQSSGRVLKVCECVCVCVCSSIVHG